LQEPIYYTSRVGNNKAIPIYIPRSTLASLTPTRTTILG